MADETKAEAKPKGTGTGAGMAPEAKAGTGADAKSDPVAGTKPDTGSVAGGGNAATGQQALQSAQGKKEGEAAAPAATGKEEARQPPKTSPEAEKMKAEVAKREEALRKLLAGSKKQSSPEVRLARKKLKRAQRKLNEELIRIGARKRPVRGKAAAAEGEKKS
ncbi:MAG: hypothetical protein N3A38_13655 [Planctomycetota bacterium]|nr:hypothetical protein [Planctomycetota bacterium]